MRPNMVVLQHHHARQVVPVGVDAADEHAVLLHEAEAWCQLVVRGVIPFSSKRRRLLGVGLSGSYSLSHTRLGSLHVALSAALSFTLPAIDLISREAASPSRAGSIADWLCFHRPTLHSPQSRSLLIPSSLAASPPRWLRQLGLLGLTRRRLPGPRNHPLPTLLARNVTELPRRRRDARAPREHVEPHTLAEEELARAAAHDRDLGLCAGRDLGALGDKPLDASVSALLDNPRRGRLGEKD